MVSRRHRKEAVAMHKELKLLRSATNSHAQSSEAVISDATRYIEQLKKRVDTLMNHQDTPNQDSTSQDPLPMVKVEDQGHGFMIQVLSETSCTGLLVHILEALEELGLEVLQARVSCSHNFHFEAIGEYENQEEDDDKDAERVKRSLMQAIQSWIASSSEDK